MKQFRKDEDGSMVLFSLFILMLMLMAGGMAVDVMRAEYMRVTIQQTLDRAVLAAADLDQTEDAKGVVVDYFDKAGLAAYLDPNDVYVNHSSAAGQLSYRRVSATASTDVDAIFMQMLGIDTLAAAGSSTAEEGITDLEISLVVDVSGSMGDPSSTGNSKIYELREAAKDFSYYMQCNPNTTRNSGATCSVGEGKVSITLVPYSEQVVVGEDLLDGFDVSAEHDDSHCVTFAASDFDTVSIPLDVELSRTGHFDPWGNGTYASNNRRTCRTNSWREIRLFVEDWTELGGYINSLSAGGNTSIDLGMKWGAALLDPSVQPIVQEFTNTAYGAGNKKIHASFANRPYAYTQDYSMKVIVLMTDGRNTSQHYLKDEYRDGLSEVWRNTYYNDRYSIYNADRDEYYYTYDGTWNPEPFGDMDGEEVTTTNTYCYWSWWYGRRCYTETVTEVVNQPGSAVQMKYQEVWEEFTTDWFGDWSWLPNPEQSWGNSTKNTRLNNICSAAKNAGIIIYTIGFEVSGSDGTVMSNCATTPAHYFSANGSNLAQTFGVIASSINQLRLTQ
ncbi:TadE/TadG family type IV pilus assembly protein [Actibacterium mucosum]|nr:TadE/TadG family type IV pilus assembly protein [Actibacterium mucosum]